MTGAYFLEMDAGPKPWGWASLLYLCLPHNFLHNHCFQFLLGITAVPIEIENNGHANFFFLGGGVGVGGLTKVHYGLCENGE